MKRIQETLFGFLILVPVAFCMMQKTTSAENSAPVEQASIARVLTTSILYLQRTMMPMASAMPEEKFNFVPSTGEFKGVRSFAQQLKHVAASNYRIAAAIVGEKPPAEAGEEEDGPASLKSKKEILAYLDHSFDYAEKAIATVDAKKVVAPIKSPFGGDTTRLGLTTLLLNNCYDHYGQLTQYLRMNGIVPPASQRE